MGQGGIRVPLVFGLRMSCTDKTHITPSNQQDDRPITTDQHPNDEGYASCHLTFFTERKNESNEVYGRK